VYLKLSIRAVLVLSLTTSILTQPSAIAASAQAKDSQVDSTAPPPGPYQAQHGSTVNQDRDQAQAEFERQAKIAANKKRQQELKRDTDKLLQLATDLKASVDRSNENILSLDVIKKAEQIEKLAKSVKDKMKAEN
jgi:hypothetical protein